MRILCIANDVPLPANSGGRVDVWRRMKALKSAGHDLTLLCWIDAGRVDPPSAAVLADLATVCSAVKILPITRSPGELAGRLLQLWRWPSHVASRWVTSRGSDLAGWAVACAPDAVLLDGLYGGAVALDLARRLAVPLIYRSHNVEHRYMSEQRQREQRGLRRLGLAANCLGLERFEREVIARSQRVMDISQEDAAFWRSQGHGQIVWVPTLVDAGFAERLSRAPGHKAHDLLYFGNLNTPNNVEALGWLVQQVLPLLPQAELRIAVAGSRPTEAVRALLASDARITLIENPPDMAAVVGDARVLVNTMLAGSGVNLKSVEMLFSDAALVSTPVGVKGMPEAAKDCFAVAATPQAFALAITQALAASAPPAAKRAAARRLFSAEALLAVMNDLTPRVPTKAVLS
ncbi:glycosyltransferase [Paucibacter sp. XJ19-41]|uniref:glycosyltransferase n=1 Tax=Paucibacter sp. XJ19-41 TaxID=2927824 RepID=UPI00234AC3C7|nr:glycosyltransferase [Paucibacter sp. XJ19-41]MDC6166636.1 glycosyltransferase [Paucibacter sp. XJ19-41]